ncbi:hypothetical protein C8A03DRAFT_34863 [Achaetomium macrosporum]|uniref:Uncharacterized protein n=1 Tax=Achaetomium macrosporum TaxID=79813 RepID=A0AAN7C8H1_9PEZI|nr:hypothetical protein C8A03DRAFT_34863 [Achaetomium macrosporum]
MANNHTPSPIPRDSMQEEEQLMEMLSRLSQAHLQLTGDVYGTSVDARSPEWVETLQRFLDDQMNCKFKVISSVEMSTICRW